MPLLAEQGMPGASWGRLGIIGIWNTCCLSCSPQKCIFRYWSKTSSDFSNAVLCHAINCKSEYEEQEWDYACFLASLLWFRVVWCLFVYLFYVGQCPNNQKWQIPLGHVALLLSLAEKLGLCLCNTEVSHFTWFYRDVKDDVKAEMLVTICWSLVTLQDKWHCKVYLIL